MFNLPKIWFGAAVFAAAGLIRPGPLPAESRSESPDKTAPGPFFKLVADVPLPGGATRFDYQSFDPAEGRLYFSHMGDGELVVFDAKAGKIVKSLPGFPVVTGVLFVPELKRVYASVTKNHEIAAVDAKTLEVIARVKDGKFPDGLAYSPKTHKLFVSDEMGGVETVINTDSNERIDTIQMGGEVGNTQIDPATGRIYACVQTRNQLVEIDPETDAIIGRYELKGADHPHGFAIDGRAGRAYVSCQGNNRLLDFNLKTHAVEADFPVSPDPDVLALDPGLNLLYVACEGGPVSVFRCGDGTAPLAKIADVDVGPRAHTVAVDPTTHHCFFPLQNLNGSPTLRIMVPSDLKSLNPAK